jgi:hypothetical protein
MIRGNFVPKLRPETPVPKLLVEEGRSALRGQFQRFAKQFLRRLHWVGRHVGSTGIDSRTRELDQEAFRYPAWRRAGRLGNLLKVHFTISPEAAP